MAVSRNLVIIIGRLGRDPELRYSQAGLPIASLRIATDESYIDKDGNKVERTEWHSVVAFQRQAENCANYLAKGSLVYIEGSLQTRKWQDQQGQDRYTTEIKAQRVNFLNRKGDNQSQGQGQQQTQSNQHRQFDDEDDLGPAFPSEPSGMSDVPFEVSHENLSLHHTRQEIHLRNSYGFGGVFEATNRVNGNHGLFDWRTTSAASADEGSGGLTSSPLTASVIRWLKWSEKAQGIPAIHDNRVETTQPVPPDRRIK